MNEAKLYEAVGTVEGLDLESGSGAARKIRISVYMQDVLSSVDFWVPHEAGARVRLGQRIRVAFSAESDE